MICFSSLFLCDFAVLTVTSVSHFSNHLPATDSKVAGRAFLLRGFLYLPDRTGIGAVGHRLPGFVPALAGVLQADGGVRTKGQGFTLWPSKW